MLAADTLEALGIKRGDYVIKVNNRKVLDGVMVSIGLSGDANMGKRLTVLRAIDKLDRLGIEGVKQLLGPGRKDESGDFTKGAGLAGEAINAVVKYVTAGSKDENRSTVQNIRSNVGMASGEGLDELDQIAALVESTGYETRVRIDPSVVRGLEYYTGPVYEAELTFEVKDEKGNPVRFGSVAGGGRYDGLVARFRGEPVPATGFSIGVSRLMAALQHLGKIDTRAEAGPVVVTVLDPARVADYQKMVKELRDAGIRAELYLGSGKMGAQLKYADKRNSPCVVIQGGDEKAKGEVQIKDLILGAKAAEEIASNKEWREGRPAQFSVAEDRLVETVREVLARHRIR
jgi:histidyl-tRNA synthetase